ncbi:MAG: hypothetical protein PWP34_1843 [Desulfuromonadales bacterium]|jgi:HAD superfamily hydrolase (TIGR01509 family)|nr:hypothetical protein [Desulfuromonadales bacterium]
MIGVRGIIYDCDGVLFDSRRANLAFYSRVFEHFGEPPLVDGDSPAADICHTYASNDVFRMLLGEERVAKARAYAATIELQPLLRLMVPEKGVLQVLRRLSESKQLALATNRDRRVHSILRHFNLAPFFTKVVTSQDVRHPKPSPDMLLAAVEGLGLTPEEVLFLGDSKLDLQAARNAGVRFVAYKGMVESELSIREHKDMISLLGLSPTDTGYHSSHPND